MNLIKGLKYIINYLDLTNNLEKIMEKTNNTFYKNEKNNKNYNKLYSNYIKDVKPKLIMLYKLIIIF